MDKKQYALLQRYDEYKSRGESEIGLSEYK